MGNIYLYGPPGSGKSTLGRGLADELGLPFVDLDTAIESAAGRAIRDIFRTEGEETFRKLELKQLESESGESREKVVALGGGALLNPAARELAERLGVILFLDVPLAKLEERAAAQPGVRPLLEREGERSPMARLLERRGEHYASFATRLDAAGDELALKVVAACALLGRFRIRGMGRQETEVRVGSGLLATLGDHFVARGWSGAALVVADENTATYGERAMAALRTAGVKAQLTTIPAGEGYKTVETVAKLWGAMIEAGVDRGGSIVAVGGGVVGDLTGFAAATWMRGVRWIGVPTTLLAMVDSSLGGKTGFDLPQGKNLVGAFHPPALVLTDTDVLATLPHGELMSGAAEAIKHCIIDDPELFEVFEESPPTAAAEWTAARVARSMAVKVGVIQEDPYEQGVRASLNLGHTIGHAIELASNFSLRHGEAIAIGMVAEALLAESLGRATESGLAERIAGLLRNSGLPTEIPAGLDSDVVRRALLLDKKNKDGVIRFALPAKVGEVVTGVAVEESSTNLRAILP